MSFKELNLPEPILKAINDLGHETPTSIQAQAIPKILEGCDLRASAQTGTGKTAAFILPALCRLCTPSSIRSQGPRILVLVPTRELAMQVTEEAMKYSKYMSRVKTVCIYGGAPYPIQNRQLSRPYEILVATPGRLLDHMEQGRIDFSRLEMLVLDEADRMLDMGFIQPVEQIAAETPKNRQTLMFSATLKGSVMNLSDRLLNKPIEIAVTPERTKHENIDQRMLFVDNLNHKNEILDHLLTDPLINQAIIFTSTKRHADVLVDSLVEYGHRAAALHGDMKQQKRTRTIASLRQGSIRILVATDVAARGIDVQTISHVINFDLPNNVEDYVHRIGRTGRAGATGIALSFVSNKDREFMKRIEQFTGQKMAVDVIPGMEPKSKPTSVVAPRPRSRYPSQRRHSGPPSRSAGRRRSA